MSASPSTETPQGAPPPAPLDAVAAERPAAVAARVVQAAGAVALVIGAAHVVLWGLGIPARWAAEGVLTVKANMAIAQALGAAALLLASGDPGERRRAVARALGAAVLAIGALTLLEHVGGVDLGIDQLFAREPAGAPGVTSPNRMGPTGATSLALLGLGLVLLTQGRRAASPLGAAVCCIVLVPTVGYVYGVGELHAEAGTTAIAWPTVVALFSLGLGLALSRAPRGPVPLLLRDDPGGALLRRVLVPAAALPIAVGWLRIQGERYGLYARNVGIGLFAVSVTVVMCLLLWRAAGRLSAAARDRRALASTASAALRASEERHRVLARDRQLALDAARLGWWHLDAERRTVTFDRRYAEIFGVAGGRAARSEILQLVHPEDAPAMHEAIEAALDPAAAAPYAAQYRIRRADGGTRWVEAHGLATFEGEGPARRFAGLVGTVEDVTERRRGEDAVREANARLVEADRRKDEFLAMLSHELRNPLAPIRNALYVLERAEPGAPAAQRALEIATRQIAHLTRLVDDLLDVTRVARGKIRLRRAEVDLAAVARRAAEDHRALLAERRLELLVRVTDAPLVVVGDETRLAQVLGNLLQNAAKFTPPGGRVTLTAAAEGGLAALRVADTGAGIEPDLLEALFSPFIQGQQTLARTEGGLGLGLALVKAIIALHGGEVRARSDGAGRGAEFVLTLPLAPVVERAAPDAARSAPG